MWKITTIITLVALLGIVGTASADTFTVELPELVGELEPPPNGSTAAFDFGTSFLSISEVRIQMSGTFTAGSAHGDGIENPADEWCDILPEISVSMYPGDGFCGTGLGPLESPFIIEEPLDLLWGATWDFLLDGTDEITAERLSPIMSGWVQVTPPTVNISGAHLSIEGVIPEPATVFLLTIGMFGLSVNKRSKSRQYK